MATSAKAALQKFYFFPSSVMKRLFFFSFSFKPERETVELKKRPRRSEIERGGADGGGV